MTDQTKYIGTGSKADPLKFAPCPNYGTELERTLFFSRLVISLDASPKRLRMHLSTVSSCVVGLMNTTTSSVQGDPEIRPASKNTTTSSVQGDPEIRPASK
jgi:hypothetical protein